MINVAAEKQSNSIVLESAPHIAGRQSLAYKVAVFYLFVLGVQFVWVEGFTVSWVKVVAMILSPFLLLICKVKWSAAWIGAGIYWGLICVSLFIRNMSVVDLSVGYTLGCLCTFATFHSLIKANVFTRDDVLDLLKKMIYIYTIFLILQQIKSYTGIGYSPLINFYFMSFNGIRKFNSLFIEPSHFGRVMAVVVFAYLELKRLNSGSKLLLKELWKSDRLTLLAAFYSLLMSGSSTAIIASGIVLIYTVVRGSVGLLLFVAFVIMLLFPFFQEKNHVQRAIAVVDVSTSLDMDLIKAEDSSAAARVAPIVAFIENFRPGAKDFWFGQVPGQYPYYSNIGIIEFYGALAYLSLLLLLWQCCFRGFCSVEFAFFCILFGGTVGNVVYVWFCMMIFALVKYFYNRSNNVVYSK